MRQSLSESGSPTAADGTARAAPTAWLLVAVALSIALGVLALVDQLGPSALVEHAATVYSPHGEDVSAALVYGLVYTVAVIDLVLWLAALLTVCTRSRWATAVASAATVLVAGLAAALLLSREYGEQVYPASWGLLALSSAVAGGIAAVQLLQRQPSENALHD